MRYQENLKINLPSLWQKIKKIANTNSVVVTTNDDVDSALHIRSILLMAPQAIMILVYSDRNHNRKLLTRRRLVKTKGHKKTLCIALGMFS